MNILLRNGKFLALAIGVILTWRGVWGLADVYLFPGNDVASFVASVIIGLVILIILKRDLTELVRPRVLKEAEE